MPSLKAFKWKLEQMTMMSQTITFKAKKMSTKKAQADIWTTSDHSILASRLMDLDVFSGLNDSLTTNRSDDSIIIDSEEHQIQVWTSKLHKFLVPLNFRSARIIAHIIHQRVLHIVVNHQFVQFEACLPHIYD